MKVFVVLFGVFALSYGRVEEITDIDIQDLAGYEGRFLNFDKLKDSLNKVVDKTKEGFNDLSDKVTDAFDKAKDGFNDFADKVTGFGKDVQQQYEAIKGQVEGIIKDIQKSTDFTCTDKTCVFCADVGKGYKACSHIILDLEHYSITIELYFNDQFIIKRTVSAKNPGPICAPLPYLPVVKMCLRPYDLEFVSKTVHACFQVELQAFTKNLASLNLQCFNISDESVGMVPSTKKPEGGFLHLDMPEINKTVNFRENSNPRLL